jgi:hypothetical protein
VEPDVPAAVTRRKATAHAVVVVLNTPTSTSRGRHPVTDINPPIGRVVDPAPFVRHAEEKRAIGIRS